MDAPNETDRRVTRFGPGRASRVFAIAACAALGGCVPDNPVQPGGGRAPRAPAFDFNPVCDNSLGGQAHVDTIDTPVTWTRANNPHAVDSDLVVTGAGRLTLEPGVVVCFGLFGRLVMENGGRLVADGLDTARITLTARYTDTDWHGLSFSGNPGVASTLKHVRLEHVFEYANAVASADSHAVVIDSSVFRRAGQGLYLLGRGASISRSRVDTTLSVSYPAVTLGTLGRFENTVIRGAAGVGLRLAGTHGVSLLGGRIEESGGTGLVVTTTGAGFLATTPIRVIGGAGYPAELVVSAFPRIYPTVATQDSLLGNARDTLVVSGGILQQFAYPVQKLPWRITGPIVVQYIGILNPHPGASLTFTPGAGITARNGGRVVARGTQAAPVLFTAADTTWGWSGIWLEGSPSLGSYLTNVRVEYKREVYPPVVTAIDSHTVVIDSAVFRQNVSSISLSSPGSRISRSRVDSTRYTAVYLSSTAKIESTRIRGTDGPGLTIDSNQVQVVSCEIRDGTGNGIELWDYDIEVHDCNLVNNAGFGIWTALDIFAANVENNWWGDAGGPGGSNGDGVSGPLLDYTPWRTTPFVLPYVP
jgi:hypothetical protein